jgi:peptidoglycan-associated lipoprotein
MNRKWMIWMVMAVLLTFLYGCPKKKPATPPSDLNVETTTVPAPPSTPSTTPQDVQQPATPEVNDQKEDLLQSSDLQVVNEELKRRGFSPDIYFDYDESNLSDDTRDKLSRNADLLKSQAQFSITLEGHADSRGTSEYNLALGERRANAVKQYLGSLGVGADRMRTVSYGKERPACTEEVESCWSQNRRVHMIITGRSNVG